uniref:DNA-directed RNA polymerase N-terminal domain-containing protein n=1 Tax=Rhizophora mucronata TaxID=61149 RepID=A0A2P2MDT6_RHIMU
MSSTNHHVLSAREFDHLIIPITPFIGPAKASTVMCRSVAKQVVSRRHTKSLNFYSFSSSCSVLGFPQEPIFPEKFQLSTLKVSNFHLGFCRVEGILTHEDHVGKSGFGLLRNGDYHRNTSVGFWPREYDSVAEAVPLSTDVEEEDFLVEEVQELVQEMRREEEGRVSQHKMATKPRVARGMGLDKLKALRRRQVKSETEAWEKAAEEYKELLTDMCEKKLAPNLPYMKTLFLGWFEPFRDAILKEQELIRLGKIRPGYAPYFNQLPAEMMAVIAMHKLTAMMMTCGEHGRARVVAAACLIGDAIEQEVGDIQAVFFVFSAGCCDLNCTRTSSNLFIFSFGMEASGY